MMHPGVHEIFQGLHETDGVHGGVHDMTVGIGALSNINGGFWEKNCIVTNKGVLKKEVLFG